ncbi:MAG: aminotransferase class I/II-fold pyridoxal phosphate-dependent enzyme [Armatimonadetes bacterium]|nr:aminotransferase class I/II-fold pyridoxal phosphate-dependent enzyme [Armatimonadota bacterium]
MVSPEKVRIAPATEADRARIYEMRHAVYAVELGQHRPNEAGRLTDGLDPLNEYLVATADGDLAGFVSITSPESDTYSIDKYFGRSDLPFGFDAGLFEVRLLTVAPRWRGSSLAVLLMYAALRWIESHGATRVVAIGRRDLREMYVAVGLRPLGPTTQAGAVTYELMSASMDDLRAGLQRRAPLLRKLRRTVSWDLGVPFYRPAQCFHGGRFFEAVGETFDTLERSSEVVNADVLDAWFPPAPGVLESLQSFLPWLLRTSPPVESAGLVRAIAAARGVPVPALTVGAGSSCLIYLALREWLTRDSLVLLPEPTYGEYVHVAEQVIGCRTERLPLSRHNGLRIDPRQLFRRAAETRADLVVLVNPNNPTGRLIPRAELAESLPDLPASARLWVDEAYVDYAGSDESLEPLAAASRNVVVCKSLSKAYALSGARVGYLCGPWEWMDQLRRVTPPWAVSLPAQVAAVAALRDPAYYKRRYAETARLRAELAAGLRQAVPGIAVHDGVANWLLCDLPATGPDAAAVCERCRARDVYLREYGAGAALGSHALRIAVKDAAGNSRVIEALARAVCADP